MKNYFEKEETDFGRLWSGKDEIRKKWIFKMCTFKKI
jgi:hypothetical protein